MFPCTHGPGGGCLTLSLFLKTVYLPAMTFTMVSSKSDIARVAWFIAGVFVCLTLPISIYQVNLT